MEVEDEEFDSCWKEIEKKEPKKCVNPAQAIPKLQTLGTDLDALRKQWIALEKYCYNNNLYPQAIKKILEKLDEAGPMRRLLREIEDKSRAAKEALEKLKESGSYLSGFAQILNIAAKAKYIFLTFPANMYYSVLGVGLKLWLGRCYGMLGDFKQAYACFMNGVESFNNFERTITNVEDALKSIPPEILARVKQIEGMEQLFNDKDTFVKQTLPSFKTTMCFSIIILYIMNGDITNAIKWFDKEWNDLSHLKEEELPSAFHSSPIMPHLSKKDMEEMNRIRTTLEAFVNSQISAAKKAFVCNILGILCQHLNEQKDSEKYHKDSLLLYEQVNNIDGIMASHFNLGHSALFINPNAEAALHHFTQIIHLAGRDRDGDLQRAQIFLGFALILDKKYDTAIDTFNSAPCPSIKEEYFVIMRLYGLALAFLKLERHRDAKTYITECVHRSKNTLHNASDSHLLLSAFELHVQLSELYQLVHVPLGNHDLSSAIEVSDWFKLSLTSLTYDANVELRDEVAVTVSQVQDLLDETSAIVVYSSCKDVLEKTRADYIYLISKNEVKEVTNGVVFKRPDNQQTYATVPVNDVRSFKRGDDSEPIGREVDLYPPDLHKALKNNNERPFSQVGFVFQGKWSNPAAFTIPNSPKYLIEEKHVCILPSLFWFVKQRSVGFTRHVPLDASTVTLLGGLTTGNLPNVIKEIDQIKDYLQVTHPTPLIAADFSRNQVIQVLRNKLLNLAHLASHNNPEGHGSTYYELSGQILLNNEELLQTDDILKCLNMERLKLVTLSCCSTAKGAELSIGPLGIYMSFIVVGAECVVATLQNIKDETAKVLMTLFYKHISQGKSKLAAYCETILDYFKLFHDLEEWKKYVVIGF